MRFCNRPFSQAYIFPNGDVRACGWTYQCIGNILEKSLEEIWHSKEAEKVRASILDGSFSCCNQVACPFCSNDFLEELSENEIKERAIVEKYPSEFNAAFDYICNHSCPSCRHEVFVPDEQYCKNMEEIIKKLEEALNLARMVSTDGNGDCFASPNIMKMLSKINPARKDFELQLETNGALCDQEHWKKIEHLKEYDINVTVTPNSFNRQTFKYLSGGHDSLDRVVKNLYFLKTLRKENKIKEFDISIVVQDTNYKELPEFVERCINDFECDRVVVKPIYYWFALTPEEYWFKDILNPKHPYFNDYMEILQHPILQHEKVYFWGGAKNIHKAKEHPATNVKMYFDVFANILKRENPSGALEDALLVRGCRNVAIYGTNDMAEIMYNLLRSTKINVVGFIDRDAKVDVFCDMPVTKFDAYRPDMVNTILVSNFAYLTNVTRDLRFRDFTGQIIPFNEILG